MNGLIDGAVHNTLCLQGPGDNKNHEHIDGFVENWSHRSFSLGFSMA